MGMGTVLARRGIMLSISLVIVVFLTAILMGATGYDEKIWSAIIEQRARAYRMQLSGGKAGGAVAPPSKIGQLAHQINLDASDLIKKIEEVEAKANQTSLTQTELSGFLSDTEKTIHSINETNMQLCSAIEEILANNTKYKSRELKDAHYISKYVGKALKTLETLKNTQVNDTDTILSRLESLKSHISKINDYASKIKGLEVNRLVESYKDELKHIYKLDQHWSKRVIPLAINTLKLDLGITTQREIGNVAGKPVPLAVSEAIKLCLPRTIVMLTMAQLISAIVALLVGPYIAYKHGSLADRIVVAYAALTNAIPVWWLALVFIFFLGYKWHIVPTDYTGIIGAINNFTKNPIKYGKEILRYAALPIVTIVITHIGSWLYSVRAMLLKVVREDFVVAAKAKGLPENMIMRKHILRTAAPPVVTTVILTLAGSIGGYIITESIFNWPGMGTLYYAAVTTGDVATILGLTYVLTGVYIAARFILEVLYIVLDPRVRY